MSKRYCVIVNGYVENVLVADEEFAKAEEAEEEETPKGKKPAKKGEE